METRDQIAETDTELVVALSELRLVKDDFEIERDAQGLPADGRGHSGGRGRAFPRRYVAAEVSAGSRASSDCTPATPATPIGYDTIAASGEHACTLHWIRNDGDLRDGDLLLLDAGVELDTLYTADVTRTLPINGRFSDAQRKVYEAVLEAQQAGHRRRTARGDVLRRAQGGDRRDRPPSRGVGSAAGQRRGVAGRRAAASTAAGWCTARRITSASTCTTAPRPGGRTTARARCEPGMIITVEPGLYFKSDDRAGAGRAARHRRADRGRHLDHIDTATRTCPAALPRSIAEVEAWMASIWAGAEAADR